MQSSNDLNHRGTSDNRNRIISVEDVFEVLTAPERRAVLYVLCRRQKPMAVEELSEDVASVQIGNARDTPERLITSLRHVHLPKLEQFSLVQYDCDSNSVEINRLPLRLKRYLRFTAEDELGVCSEDATA
ncbi:hypothetical protein SAMN05421858_2045 [Haladaptatus litoreus]|uniref:DUF7344 domain-containing protein n=1 Tax=Haladaptatus litoreus TaxID=553468 RepID=A0A1N6ZIS2_9EURY|nr:hypothetical protein [Haladaptatus litoreus]SIR26621.1 hypothetical protein SAMN05421858_2045 [Haladaptatus litoreus]